MGARLFVKTDRRDTYIAAVKIGFHAVRRVNINLVFLGGGQIMLLIFLLFLILFFLLVRLIIVLVIVLRL